MGFDCYAIGVRHDINDGLAGSEIRTGVFGELGKGENGSLGEEITPVRLQDSNIILGKHERGKALHRLSRIENSMRQIVLL